MDKEVESMAITDGMYWIDTGGGSTRGKGRAKKVHLFVAGQNTSLCGQWERALEWEYTQWSSTKMCCINCRDTAKRLGLDYRREPPKSSNETIKAMLDDDRDIIGCSGCSGPLVVMESDIPGFSYTECRRCHCKHWHRISATDEPIPWNYGYGKLSDYHKSRIPKGF
jgi:hypothetical protein